MNTALGRKVVMTVFIAFTVFGLLAIAALFWCLRGFSRELKQGRKVIGVVVRIEATDARQAVEGHAARNTSSVIEMMQPRTLRPGSLAGVRKAQ